MKKNFSKVIALVLALSCLFSGTAFSANISADSNAELVTDTLTAAEYAMVYNEENYENEFEPGVVIVGLKSETSASSYDNLFSELDITAIEDIGNSTLVLTLKEQTRQSVLDAIEVLKDNPSVYAAEPNYYMYGIEPIEVSVENIDNTSSFSVNSTANPANTASENESVYPNETSKYFFWNLSVTGAYQAWAKTTGSSSISVGVLDSGITPISDLAANVDMENGANCINPDILPTDDHGHGTQVASIIGAVGNNGIGIAGICWDVNLVPFKVLDSNKSGVVDDTIEAINIANELGIPILNMSFANGVYNANLERSIKNYDGLVVAAAGNNNGDIDTTPVYPARYADTCSNIIVVAASTHRDDYEYVWLDSNYGKNSVHLVAPGAEVNSNTVNSNVEWTFGSSIAAPHVAGTAALILSIYPHCTPEQLIYTMLYTVDIKEQFSDYCMTSGRLNIANAIEYFTSILGSGDIDNDGSVSNADIIVLARHLDGIRELTGMEPLSADINIDGTINDTDLDLLIETIVEMSTEPELQLQ